MRLPPGKTKRGTTTASVSLIPPRWRLNIEIELKGRPLEILEFEFTSAVPNWSNKRNRDCPRSKWLLEHADGAKRGHQEAARSGPERAGGMCYCYRPSGFLERKQRQHLARRATNSANDS